MKKVLFLIAAAALMLASCTQEKLENPAAGQETNVTFTVRIPENIATKAYSEGERVTKLVYAVYDSNSKTLRVDDDAEVKDGVAVIDDLVLITGKTYDLLFWAQSERTEAYSVSLKDQTLTVDYDKIFANDDNNDAFYAFRTFTINGVLNETIELYRPFAQVNVVTNDANLSQDKSFEVEKTSLKARVANVLNFADGTVSGEDDVLYAAHDVPIGTLANFSQTGYDTYLSMNYLLVGASQTTTNCEFAVYESGKTEATNTITVANVPVQRNYRTNIYGSLLTDPASLKVVIESAFEKEDKPYPTDPTPVGNNTYEINTSDALKKIGEIVATEKPNEGKIITFKLTADIDMSGVAYTPLSAHWVNFDGQGHTISNLNCGADATGKSGFCGYLGAATIKDLTLENVTAAGEQAGIVAGHAEAGNLENVTIKGTNSVSYLDTAYDESWGGVAAIFGVNVAGERPVGVTIDEDAVIYVNKNDMVTDSPDGNKYAMLAGVTVTDNGSVRLVETIVEGLLYNAEAKTYEVSSANGLIYMASGVTKAAGVTIGADENVLLTADIDLAGVEFAGLSAFNSENPNTFDGQGFTVSNVTNTSQQADMGFIRSWTGTIKNVTIKNAEFKTRGRSAILAANIHGDIENCHIVGGSIGDRYWACGAIAGLYNAGNITDCTVDGVLISSNGGVGGIVGVINETAGERKITRCKVVDSDVISSGAYGSPYEYGAIFGMANVTNSTIIVTDCVVENSNPVNLYGWAEESTAVKVDGLTMLDGIVYDDVNYVISNANGLRWFAAQVNNKAMNLQNKNVKLGADIDLAGQDWTPINGWDGVLNGTVIDGQGYTVSNMTVNGGSSCGFISNNASSVIVRNLTFDNAVVKAQEGNGTYAGVVMGKNYSPVTLENVHVTNSAVKNNWQSGGLVGFAEGNAPVFNGCSISDSFVGGSNCTCGAFFGLGGVDITCTECVAANVSLYTDMAAGFVGYLYGKTLTEIDCTSTNVVVVSEYPAGL